MSTGKLCPTCGTEYPMSERFCPRDGTALRSQDAAADLVGSVIAERYHVMRKLGEGGMGAVYLAEHVKMGRKSAIKVMNPGMSQDPDAIARFNREASNASRMSHPNICAIYDFGETADGLIYLAMEYIEGRSLTALIKETGSVPPKRAASILHQTADALQVAHDYGIVHRDLKPDNIMIATGRDGGDQVKVVDFGIAKAHTSDAQKVTKTGLVVGTPEYMSPEQLAGDKLDGRSDIYSLALVGFNMLTGTLPFPAQTAQEMMIMRLTDDPKTLAEMKPGVAWPPQLQAVMDRALARDAAQRYQKAADFGREFAMAIDAMPSAGVTEAGTVVIGAKAAAGPTAALPKTRVERETPVSASPAQAPPVPARKNTMAMMVGVGGVAVAALVVAIVMSQGDNANGATPDDGAVRPPPADTPTRDDTTTQGKSQAIGNRGGATGPTGSTGIAAPTGRVGAPPVTTPPPVEGPPVGETLNRLERLVDGLTDPQAQQGLRDLSGNLLAGATAVERTRIYYLRAVFNYHLDKDGDRAAEVCLNGRNALAGPGLNTEQDTQIRFIMAAPEIRCGSNAEAA